MTKEQIQALRNELESLWSAGASDKRIEAYLNNYMHSRNDIVAVALLLIEESATARAAIETAKRRKINGKLYALLPIEPQGE